MAFVRRFCSPAEFGFHSTGIHICRGLNFTSQPGRRAQSQLIGTSSVNRGHNNSSLHVYFSRMRPSMIGKAATTNNGCDRQDTFPNHDRSRSLHWDRREMSLMCLRDSSYVSTISNTSHDCPHRERLNEQNQDELPVLVWLERSTINHALSMLTSSLPVHDSLKEVAATLRRLSTSMHVQSVFETAAKPCQESSDDIIIRNHPNKHQSADDINCTKQTEPQYINNFHSQHDVSNQEFNYNLRFIQSDVSPIDRLEAPNLQSATDRPGRVHLYFNKVQHVPMVASEPKPDHLQSPADDICNNSADVKTSQEEDTISPHQNNDHRPSKEQILNMHEKLSNELPNFLLQPHDFSMYANAVVFDNRIMRLKTRGLPAYKACIQSLKHLGMTYMTASSMEVLRVTADLDQCQIQARWRIKGVPLHSYIIRPWRRNHPHRYFDAFSSFDVGTDGLIHRHKLDKVIPNPSDKVRSPSLAARIGIALGVVRNPALSPNCMVSKPLTFIQPKTSNGKL